VFAYQVVGDRGPLPREMLFEFREALYGFIGVRVTDYARASRQLSAAWDTVTVPSATFRELAAPVDWFFEQSVELFRADDAAPTWFGDAACSEADTRIAEQMLAKLSGGAVQ
jgi:hypothetical protein